MPVYMWVCEIHIYIYVHILYMCMICRCGMLRPAFILVNYWSYLINKYVVTYKYYYIRKTFPPPTNFEQMHTVRAIIKCVGWHLHLLLVKDIIHVWILWLILLIYYISITIICLYVFDFIDVLHIWNVESNK